MARLTLLGAFLGAAFLLASGCGERRRLREWRPEDHGQPQQPQRTPVAGPPSDADDPQTVGRAAAALWTVSCAGCHGREGRGDGAERPSDEEVADFTAAAWQESRSDQEITAAITQGSGSMQGFGDRVNAQGIAALVAHIRSLGRRAP